MIWTSIFVIIFQCHKKCFMQKIIILKNMLTEGHYYKKTPDLVPLNLLTWVETFFLLKLKVAYFTETMPLIMNTFLLTMTQTVTHQIRCTITLKVTKFYTGFIPILYVVAVFHTNPEIFLCCSLPYEPWNIFMLLQSSIWALRFFKQLLSPGVTLPLIVNIA